MKDEKRFLETAKFLKEYIKGEIETDLQLDEPQYTDEDCLIGIIQDGLIEFERLGKNADSTDTVLDEDGDSKKKDKED